MEAYSKTFLLIIFEFLSHCSQRRLERKQNWTRHSLMDEAAGEVPGGVGKIEGESVVVDRRTVTETLVVLKLEA